MMTKEEFIKQKREKTFLVITEEEGDSITPISLYETYEREEEILIRKF